MSTGICRLCTHNASLKDSHIIPKFIFRWLKETSATGYLRSGLNPNKRQQDGPKRPMLCEECEQRFSDWENEFAKGVFSPLREGQGFETFQYGPWLAKFAASLSWRVLLEIQSFGPLSYLPPELIPKLTEAEAIWRAFLLGTRRYISPYDVHLIPLGYLKSHTFEELPPNINRYFARDVAIDVVHSKAHTFVYTKLPFAVIVGLLQTTKPWEWAGTSLFSDGDTFGKDKRLGVPGVLGEYMNGKSVRISEIYQSISKKQLSKIGEFMKENPDKVANSKTFEAMSWDVDMFGRDAFASE
jgi:hypothetical protein